MRWGSVHNEITMSLQHTFLSFPLKFDIDSSFFIVSYCKKNIILFIVNIFLIILLN
jgi:hypothetical protein